MALAGILARAAQRHALIEGDVVADDGGFTDHHAVAVVDKQPLADHCAGMDLDAGLSHGALADHARQELKMMRPEPVGASMAAHRLVAGVTDHDLDRRSCGGVAAQHGLNIPPPLFPIRSFGHKTLLSGRAEKKNASLRSKSDRKEAHHFNARFHSFFTGCSPRQTAGSHPMTFLP